MADYGPESVGIPPFQQSQTPQDEFQELYIRIAALKAAYECGMSRNGVDVILARALRFEAHLRGPRDV